jgi:hypothetical protein
MFKCSIQFVPYAGTAWDIYGDIIEAAGNNANSEGEVDVGGAIGDLILDKIGDAAAGALRDGIPSPGGDSGGSVGDIKGRIEEVVSCMEVQVYIV